ncbi:hypothetical protein BDW69DRAFT_183518 [Aspergillus filifer]
MSSELNAELASLGREYPQTTSQSQEQSHSRKRGSLSSTKGKLVELRPKGPVVLVAPGSPMEFKRKQHAQAQKQQRDRLKAALDRIAAMLPGAGVGAGASPDDGANTNNAGTGGTKVRYDIDGSMGLPHSQYSVMHPPRDHR